MNDIFLIPQDGAPGAKGDPGDKGDTGDTGPAGPNEVTAATSSTLVGILQADGTNVGTVTIGTGLSYSGGTLSVSGGSGIGGSTGATDNAILRADGTGGSTLQTSNLTIDDLYTASPNNVVNYVCAKIEGGTTNVGLALVPKGTGAFSLAVPDGTTVGGNARGANAVDLQTSRNANSAVASGQFSSVIGGLSNVASSIYAVVTGGNANTASVGNSPTVTGGNNNTASADFARCGGFRAVADQYGMDAWSGGGFADFGSSSDNRIYRQIVKARTTNATPARMRLNGLNQTALFTTIAPGRVLLGVASILGVRSDGVSVACYRRRFAIKRIGSTTSIVGAIESIGTDIEDNAATDVAITADDTNESLDITVTGIAGETWRWVAVVEGVEIAFGT